MTDRELSRLRRTELLEMLIEQGKENERLQQQLKIAQDALAERKLAIEESGSMAEAAFKLNDVLVSAQNAVDLYVENVKRSIHQQKEETAAALRDAQIQASQTVADADLHSRSILDDTRRQADELIRNARTEAERILADAKAAAAQTRRDAVREKEILLAQAQLYNGEESAAAPSGRRKLGDRFKFRKS